MMQFLKRVLTKKKGVTILEGLIALGLLALVAAGTFGVLLSVARKSGAPDIREEMVLAVERANDQLQMYSSGIVSGMTNSKLYEQYANGMCGGSLIRRRLRFRIVLLCRLARITLSVCFRPCAITVIPLLLIR